MNIKDFKVGQAVFVLDNDARNRVPKFSESAVAKVGRKYVTVGHDCWDMQFGAEDWADGFLVEKAEIGSKKYLFPSQESVNSYLEMRDLWDRLRTAAQWQKVDKYSLAQLRAAVRILEDPNYKEGQK